MQTVAETPTFTRQVERLFSEDERRELIDYLANHPTAGDEIPGTGGVRKLALRCFGSWQEGWCTGGLLLQWQRHAGLRASRLCEIR